MKSGIGYDIHRLVEGRKLIIGGVEIPFEKGLLGHSDADVLIHALIDALFGATGKGDIGTHFPDTDPKWKNKSSIALLANAHEILLSDFYTIQNIDCTIICEAPKLAPYLEEMRENISDILGCGKNCINIKAKTNEGLDSVGRGEAIAAQAVVLLG